MGSYLFLCVYKLGNTLDFSPFDLQADTGSKRGVWFCPRLHSFCVAAEQVSGRVFAAEGTGMGHQTAGIRIPLHRAGLPLPDHWHFAASWPLSLWTSSIYFQSLLYKDGVYEHRHWRHSFAALRLKAFRCLINSQWHFIFNIVYGPLLESSQLKLAPFAEANNNSGGCFEDTNQSGGCHFGGLILG